MDYDETHALFAKGRDAWNAWAQAMLDERKALEESGKWEDKRIDWQEKATVRFSNYGNVYQFNETTTFQNFTFPYEVYFLAAEFNKTADFSFARFYGRAFFANTKFFKLAIFNVSEFHNIADFYNSNFYQKAYFSNTKFFILAHFEEAIFHDCLYFIDTKFIGETNFYLSQFKKLANFTKCLYLKKVSYSSIEAESAFILNNTMFITLPDFTQAHFLEAPQLNNVDIKPNISEENKRDVPAMWRALKRMAATGHDYQNELRFSASEMKAERIISEFPVSWIFSWLYDCCSDYGRSVIRPAIIWFIILLVSYFSYLIPSLQIGALNIERGISCVQNDANRTGLPNVQRLSTNADREAMSLAFRSGLIFIDLGSEATRRIYGCLYGFENDANNMPDTKNPILPAKVSNAIAIQKILSSIFIFLFGLGVRNLLRMK